MHLTLRLPGQNAWQRYIFTQSKLPFSYLPLHSTRQCQAIPGFDNDFLRVKIGEGEPTFHRACEAIRRWQMFPAPWTKIYPENAPIQIGMTVSVYARFLRIWWGFQCRILHVVEEPERFGFAYGTLPGHIERGEELFLVEIVGGEFFFKSEPLAAPGIGWRKWVIPS